MKGGHDFSATTSASGQRSWHQPKGYRINVNPSPSARRQTMPPHLLRLDSTGEVARNDQMGVQRKNPFRPDTAPPVSKHSYGIIRSFMQPLSSHMRDMHSRSYLVSGNQTSCVLQGLNALEELYPTKLDSMASYNKNKMQYAKQANPCRFSCLGGFSQRPEWTFNYAMLPQGVFPCHVFKAMHSQRTFAAKQASGHIFKPSTVKQQTPFLPYRSHCTTTMTGSTAKLTSEHASGCSLGVITRGDDHSKNTAAEADTMPSMEQNGYADERLLGIKLRNGDKCESSERNINTETDCVRSPNCSHVKDIDAKTVEDEYRVSDSCKEVKNSCKEVKTISCDNLHIPSVQPSLSILDNDKSKSAPLISDKPIQDHLRISTTSSSMVKDDSLKTTSGSKDVKKSKEQPPLSSCLSQVVTADGNKVGTKKIVSIMPEQKTDTKLPCEAKKFCSFLTFSVGSFCDELDDDFWSDSECETEAVDSDSQKDALAYFMTKGSTLTGYESVSQRLQDELKTEEKNRAQMQEALSRANTAWEKHYSDTLNPDSLSSKVQFSCGKDVDKLHVYEADPTCAQEYLACQTADAAERRMKLQGLGGKDDREEDEPIDYRFGIRRENGELSGRLEEHDEDVTDCVSFASLPGSEHKVVKQDREVSGELELSQQEEESSSDEYEEDEESSEETDESSEEEDGECDVGGEVDDGDIDIVFKSE